jgi:uncharacterized protein (TIGR02594 family)
MSYAYLLKEKAPRILVEAVKMMGTKEIKGPKHNPEIMRWAKVVGLEKTYTADEIPWCGLAMAYAAHMAGLEVPKIALRALAWNNFGVQVQEAMLGDILTFTRNGGGHVGIYVGEDKDCYHVLGGNQSDAMNVTRILKSRLSQIRRTKWKIAQPASVRKIELDAKGKISTNEA